MSIADAIPDVVGARTARDAARVAERAARDAFIVPELAALSSRFEELLAEALGFHARIAVAVTTVVVPVQGRTFATLTTRVVRAQSTLTPVAQTVTFTPQLDFREPDQFGRIACELDFAYRPRRSRRDSVAGSLLERGIQMRGTTVGALLLATTDGLEQLTARHLEDAFTAWWLS
jgi:hypothetical protein